MNNKYILMHVHLGFEDGQNSVAHLINLLAPEFYI